MSRSILGGGIIRGANSKHQKVLKKKCPRSPDGVENWTVFVYYYVYVTKFDSSLFISLFMTTAINWQHENTTHKFFNSSYDLTYIRLNIALNGSETLWPLWCQESSTIESFLWGH